MNARELKTWNGLRTLDFDAADAALPFSRRLARDNAWARAFAERAIEEYRKFCFLAVHAGHPVTPSDEVDQVWHLHLLYSRHYWEELCRDVLGMPLHHGPTRGGSAEGRKYRDWYEHTLEAYRRYFGEPPAALWPAADERFHSEHDFVRVDRRHALVIDRRLLKRGLVAGVGGAGALSVAHALAQAESASTTRLDVLIWLVAAAAAVVCIIAFVANALRGRTAHARKQDAGDVGVASCGASSGKSSTKAPAEAGPDTAADGSSSASGCSGGAGCGAGCGGS